MKLGPSEAALCKLDVALENCVDRLVIVRNFGSNGTGSESRYIPRFASKAFKSASVFKASEEEMTTKTHNARKTPILL